MNLREKAVNKKIEKAMRALSYELKRETEGYNTQICLATSALMAGSVCSAIASTYNEVANVFLAGFLIGSVVLITEYNSNLTKGTNAHMYNIFKHYGALSENANKEAVCYVLSSYAYNYNELMKNKANLNRKQLATERKALAKAFSKKIEAINNEERSEELFN